MFLNHHDDTSQLAPRKAAALLQSDRIEQEFGPIGIPLDVDMGGFGAVAGIDEEPKSLEALSRATQG